MFDPQTTTTARHVALSPEDAKVCLLHCHHMKPQDVDMDALAGQYRSRMLPLVFDDETEFLNEHFHYYHKVAEVCGSSSLYMLSLVVQR